MGNGSFQEEPEVLNVVKLTIQAFQIKLNIMILEAIEF